MFTHNRYPSYSPLASPPNSVFSNLPRAQDHIPLIINNSIVLNNLDSNIDYSTALLDLNTLSISTNICCIFDAIFNPEEDSHNWVQNKGNKYYQKMA